MTAKIRTPGPGSANPVKIVANIFIAFIGAGVLGLPYAFKEAGVLEGIIVMIVVAGLSIKSMLLLIKCKYRLISSHSQGTPLQELGAPLLAADDSERSSTADIFLQQNISYGDIGNEVWGNFGRMLVNVTIMVSQIGFCCGYLIFICENLDTFHPTFRLIHWLLLILPPLFVLSMLRHLSSLAIFSLFAQISNLFAFSIVFWFDFQHAHLAKYHPKEFIFKGLPFYTAVAIYCFEGAGMILSLESSLSPKVRHRFPVYFVGTLTSIVFLYITFGVSGYLSFGPETREIITLNLPVQSGLDFAVIVKGALCLSLFFAYPVMMFPATELVEKNWLHGKHYSYGVIARAGLVATTGIVVLVIPNFATLMALIGATCCNLLMFILPAVFHASIFRKSLSLLSSVTDVILFSVGILGTILGSWDFLQRLTGAIDNKGTETTIPL